MSIDTKALRELYAHVQASDNAGLQLHLLATAARNLPALLDAYDRLSALEVELASLRTDRDGAAEACRMLQEDKARLEQQLAAAQAEVRELRERAEKAERNYQWMVERAADQHLSGYRELARRAADAENVADGLRAELARVRELAAKWRAAPQNPDEPLLAMAADELEAALSQAAEQHDPLAVSDHCGECGEPEPECVCDERESLPLMARREWTLKGAQYAYRDRDSAWFQSVDKPGRAWEFCYRIADTDEHGLPVIERTADMPEGAKYRLTWIMQADAAGGDVEYTDSLPLALEANRSGAVSERIEDYRESGQEGR